MCSIAWMAGLTSKRCRQSPRFATVSLIDALDAIRRAPFEGTVWRVVREGRDPLQCSASGGRWDDGSFDVLYTSRKSDGAIAEMYFHLLRGQPVFPSKIRYHLHELNVSLDEVMTLTMDDLASLGLDATRFGQLSYNERTQEYPRSQEIAEVAHFLDCDGLLAPSARWDCNEPHTILRPAEAGCEGSGSRSRAD